MKYIVNNHGRNQDYRSALSELLGDAETLSIAVSYIQLSGWELLQQYNSKINMGKMRIVCTDQFGITQPTAIKRAIRSGVSVHNFTENKTYHPKVYLAHDKNSRPIRVLIGSANLSISAFSTSIEVGVMDESPEGLAAIDRWFSDLYEKRSEAFTPKHLREMEINWRIQATKRIQDRLIVRKSMEASSRDRAIEIAPEDLGSLEDIFATIQLPIGLLNMDYAGNNIRNIAKAREVLRRVRVASDKQLSELKLLGFIREGELTTFGSAAARVKSDEEFALLWCMWLKQTPDHELQTVNDKLLVAKRVFPQFWRLKEDVRAYFLENAQRPSDRRTLQTIELLCNAHEIVQNLSLDEIHTLSKLLVDTLNVPEIIHKDITDYFNNKGTRGWDFPDRRILPIAWKKATA